MSITSQIQHKAASMAEAMAQRARTPQEIESVRQRLVLEIQRGGMPPYIGVPLVQDLTQRLAKAKAQMAQQVAGMGIPPAPQGAPIAQQVMAQAQQPTGVDALPSNLPESYAPGGLVAFDEGGEVERFADQGLVGSDPERRLRAQLTGRDTPTYLDPQSMEQLPMAWRRYPYGIVPLPQRNPLTGQMNPAYVASTSAIPPAPATAPTDAAMDQAIASFAGNKTQAGATPATPATRATPATPATPAVRVPTFTTPNVELAKYKPGEAPTPYNYFGMMSTLPKEAQEISEKAVEAKKKELAELTDSLYKGQEEGLGKREKKLEEDTKVDRLLNIMEIGFKIAGSPKGLGAAVADAGSEGIKNIIKTEAANRAAKEKFEDYRDNMARARAADKKGDISAAEAAGHRARADLVQMQQLKTTAAQATDAAQFQRYQAGEQARQFGTQLEQQGRLGIAGLEHQTQALNLQARQLAATVDYQTKALAQMERRIDASDRATAARLKQAMLGAAVKWDAGPGVQMAAQLAKEYGPNWRTGQDARSLTAQLLYKQQRNSALMDAGSAFELSDGKSARSADSLLESNP